MTVPAHAPLEPITAERPRHTAVGSMPTLVGQVLIVAVPALVGALLGLALAVIPSASYRAVVLVDAGPGATVADSLNVSTDVANRFVQTELLYVDIDDVAIRTQISSKLGIDNPPSVTARQIGSTNVVEIGAVGPTPEKAAAAANIAADVYSAGWKQRATADLERSLATVSDRINAISARLKELPSSGGTPAEGAERDALTGELNRLTTQQASATFQRDSINASQRVVAPAQASEAVKTSSVSRNVLLGGLLGLIVGVAVLVLLRRRAAGDGSDRWAE